MTDTDSKTEHAKAEAPAKRTFSRERLAGPDGPAFAGCEPHVLAGALFLSDARKQNFTREDIDKLVENYATREIPAPKEADER